MEYIQRINATMISNMFLDWRIYYGDGSTFDSQAGDPKDAPKLNVQCLSVADENIHSVSGVANIGHFVLHNWQYYLHHKDIGWFGLFTDFDLLDHFIHYANDIDCVLKARTIRRDDFECIFKSAVHDNAFATKTDWVENHEAPRQNGIFDAAEHLAEGQQG